MKKIEIFKRQIDNVKKHTCFRHYTTTEALSHIFGEKRLRLSALRRVNDPVEEMRMIDRDKNTYFSLSWSHDQNENIPLWRLWTRLKWNLYRS